MNFHSKGSCRSSTSPWCRSRWTPGWGDGGGDHVGVEPRRLAHGVGRRARTSRLCGGQALQALRRRRAEGVGEPRRTLDQGASRRLRVSNRTAAITKSRSSFGGVCQAGRANERVTNRLWEYRKGRNLGVRGGRARPAKAHLPRDFVDGGVVKLLLMGRARWLVRRGLIVNAIHITLNPLALATLDAILAWYDSDIGNCPWLPRCTRRCGNARGLSRALPFI